MIFTYCPEGGYMGSGVAVSSYQVITAKHVITCHFDDGTPEPKPNKIVVLYKGDKYEVKIDKVSDEADIARLAVDATPFRSHSHPVDTAIERGDKLCTITGKQAKKCGFVVEANSEEVTVAVKGVPGNSGSPFFDESGNVVGILTRATMNPMVEELTLFVPVHAWKDLVP